MNIWNIGSYILLSLLGMSLIFVVMSILSFGYLRDEEKMMRKLAEMEEN